MTILTRLRDLLPTMSWPGWSRDYGTEIGRRTTEENSVRYLYQQMLPDMELRATILEIRRMDRLDPRVKKIHGRISRTATKGGLRLEWAGQESKRIRRKWEAFSRRLSLDRPAKLESDGRGMVMEGNLAIQWVVSDGGEVVAGLRMPTETLMPLVNESGRLQSATAAYAQYDLTQGRRVAEFPLWQLTLERLDPASIDDQGALGRPYLDACRTAWRQLRMTEEDLVIRRRQRAPLRFAHVLEGAQKSELEAYKAATEYNQRTDTICTDFFLNRKGSVTALQGDANLDQIADIAHLLDTFFAGAPAPKGLFGYAGDLSRDVLEDLKIDYYDEIDALQDTQSWVYEQGFRLQLLLDGIDPDSENFHVIFAERRTETPNQAADRALKYQALGIPVELCWETAGLDAAAVQARVEDARNQANPYPDNMGATPVSPASSAQTPRPNVSIVPGNAPKGESATTISTRNAR
ncbi:MAG: hypothetical protein ABTR07_15265 [Candidatus Competibacter denitrificans]